MLVLLQLAEDAEKFRGGAAEQVEQAAGLTVGSRVRCLYPADNFRYMYPATIMRMSTDGTTAVVKWDDGDTEYTK